jgi:lysophospholipase L1-like esterase
MGRGCAQKSEGLSEEYKKIAELTKVHYLDANEVVSAPVNDVDYMHLTGEGHRQLALALAPVIRELV